MNRPVLERPRMEEWHNDDEQLSNLLDFVDNKVLNINHWTFRIPHLNKEVSFDEVVKNIQERHPKFEWVEAMKDSFIYLPTKFTSIKKELFIVFKRFTLNLQERLNYSKALEEYCDSIEERMQYLKEENDLLKEKTNLSKVYEEMDSIKELIRSQKTVTEKPVIEKPKTTVSASESVKMFSGSSKK